MKTEKGTGRVKVRPYIEDRDYVINEILNNVKTVYKDDNEILSGVIDLTVSLQTAKPHPGFVQDLRGFMMWASMTNQDARTALTTCIHDLSEFARNRDQKWFCPRTNGYSKYLTGASNVSI